MELSYHFILINILVFISVLSNIVSKQIIISDEDSDAKISVNEENYYENASQTQLHMEQNESNIHDVAHYMEYRHTDNKVLISDSRHKRSMENDAAINITDNEKINNCILIVSTKSTEKFNSRVLHYKADVITLNLNFSKTIDVNRRPGVILPLKWRWVYKETGANLRMPYSAHLWSLGLLALHNGRPVNVGLSYSSSVPKYCYNLTIGERITDQIIGNALGKMTEFVASKYFRYNSSHWCYVKKIEENETKLLSTLYKSFVRLIPDLENMCCLFNNEVDPDAVVCMRTYTFDLVWWDVPIGLGIFMLLYFPLLFLKLLGILHEKIRKSSAMANAEIRHTIDDLNNAKFVSLENTKKQNTRYVYLKKKWPITAGSVIMSAVSHLVPGKASTKSRLVIFLWTLLTLVIPGVEVLVYYINLYDHVVDLAKANITVSWTTVMLGWEGSQKKLNVFGGQFIALGLYLIFGWVIMLSPKIMADEIYNGVVSTSKDSLGILSMSLERKEALGSVNIDKHMNGYIRLYKLQVCHIYMLVNFDFWKFVFVTLKERWVAFALFFKRLVPNKFVRYIIAFFILPIYIILSLTEVVLVFTFYTVPFFSFIFYVLKGFCFGLNNYLEGKCCGLHNKIGLVLRTLACGVMTLLFIFHLYIFTLLFMHSFIFLARILMFTFTALVAYPSETYGYFMLFLVSAYFGLEGFFRFGDIYKLILKTTIKLCRFEDSLKTNVHIYLDSNSVEIVGLSRELFEYLVERIRPLGCQRWYEN